MGVVGSAVILQWAYQLCKEAAWELLDGHAKEIDLLKVRFSIENSGHAVLDLHMWKVGPKNFVCQMIVESKTKKGADFFRDHLKDVNGVTHLIVEERQV